MIRMQQLCDLAETGLLKKSKTIGIMPISTGLSFTVWSNDRHWRPGKSLTLFGSIRIHESNLDSVVSASKLAALNENNNLVNGLIHPCFNRGREIYIQNLIKVINSATILYSLSELVICSGFADASNAYNYQLEQILNDYLRETVVELNKSVKVVVAKEGNMLQLIGALVLAKVESIAVHNKIVSSYDTLDTEIPYGKDIQLQVM